MTRNIVYGLMDSRNDLVYYVGKSTVGDSRAIQHLVGRSHSKEVNEWVREMNNNWIEIKAVVLEEVEDVNDLSATEAKWIDICKKTNDGLLNKIIPTYLISNVYTEIDDKVFRDLSRVLSIYPEIIRKRRITLNMTQEELAEKSNIHRSTVRDVENGKNASVRSIYNVVLALTGESILFSEKHQNKKRCSKRK